VLMRGRRGLKAAAWVVVIGLFYQPFSAGELFCGHCELTDAY